MNHLIISEKNIAAQRIATILSGGKYKKSSFQRVPYYDFDKGEEGFTVIGLRGHIINLDYPEEYRNWRAHPVQELVNVEPEKCIQAKAVVNTLRKLAPEADVVVVATDFDREGELIGTEALDFVVEINPDVTVKRARFSALTPIEIREAFDNLQEVDFKLAEAAASRQVVDLAWGATLTRFISLASQQGGSQFLSVGRVQSPTLALVVEREKEVTAFEPEEYWRLMTTLAKDAASDTKARPDDPDNFQGVHDLGRIFDKTQAEELFAKLETAKQASVTKLTVEVKQERPPSPFDTTSFLLAAGSIGLGVARAMVLAEELYTSGFISYPRTDNMVYPRTLGLRRILEGLSKLPGELGSGAATLAQQEKVVPTRGRKQTTDHPPIHPTGLAPKKKLSDEASKVYTLVVQRFLATVAPWSEGERTDVELDISGELFKAEGYRILSPGWRTYYPFFKPSIGPLPLLAEDELLDILAMEMAAEQTKPPSRFNQGGLIREMEKLGLGTKATRHDILQKLYDRRYVEGNPLRPTISGQALATSLVEHGGPIARPEMTAQLEAEMAEIADGTKELSYVVDHSRQLLAEVLATMEGEKEIIGTEIRKAIEAQNLVGSCPSCQNDLMIRRSRRGKRFVGCKGYPDCTVTYPLPPTGKLVQLPEICDHCSAPRMVRYAKGKRPWYFCLNMDCPSKKSVTPDPKPEEATKGKVSEKTPTQTPTQTDITSTE